MNRPQIGEVYCIMENCYKVVSSNNWLDPKFVPVINLRTGERMIRYVVRFKNLEPLTQEQIIQYMLES